MKIKLSTIYASPHMTAQPGSTIDVSDEEGAQLVAGRYGVAIEDAKLTAVAPAKPADAAETADSAAPETAAIRTGGRGSRARSTAAPAKPADADADE